MNAGILTSKKTSIGMETIMKNGAMLAFLLLFVATVPLFAQQFDSGSDGSYGPIHVPSSTAVTIDVPLDGIIHATTVTIDHYGSLHFRANELNTPVYLLATGDVTLSTYNTSVSVSGRNAEGVIGGAGGPGGFGGGHGAAAGGSASAGFGPGAGGAGTGPCSDSGGGGAYRTAGSSANVGQPYGSQLLLPLVGGSGGGGLAESAIGGGGGGGAILIASNTQIVINGHISAAGGGGCNASNTNGGSGGAVRLVAPKVIGYGTFQVGSVNVWGASGGGSGRIRVDALQPVSGIDFEPDDAVTVGTFMKVFPDVLPQLHITSVAGNAISRTSAAAIMLPAGASTTQDVVLEATNFTGTVPVRVVVTPESGGGNAATFDGTVTVPSGATTASTTISVTIPVNTPVKIHAWTL